MDKFLITGGRPLEGRVQISGAKNSALPCMAAALLTSETVILHNLPYVRDIITMRRLLEDLGCSVLMPEQRTLKITAESTGEEQPGKKKPTIGSHRKPAGQKPRVRRAPNTSADLAISAAIIVGIENNASRSIVESGDPNRAKPSPWSPSPRR